MISEESIPETDLEGEKLARIHLGKTISCTEKKILLMTYITLKNVLTPLYVGEKISNPKGLGKKFLPKLNHPYPLPPQKSNGQPHRDWERGGFDSLVDVICQQNGWRAFIMWWFSSLKFCILRLKIRR